MATKKSPRDDPNVPHPGKVFSGGAWRTLEAAERKLKMDNEKYKERWKNDPGFRFRRKSAMTLYEAKRKLERSRQHADELYV